MEKTAFREALIAHIHATGVPIAELSRRTGVPKTQLDKLMQRRVASTNVADATTIARFFGKSVEEFVGIAAKPAGINETQERIKLLLQNLSREEQELLEAQIEGIAARRGRS